MNTAINKVKPKEFSFKNPTMTTTLVNQSQKDSKDPNSSQNNISEKPRTSQLDNSADVSNIDQSMAKSSVGSEDGFDLGPKPLIQTPFKSDNDFTNRNSKMVYENSSFKRATEFHEIPNILGNTLVYKTDPELQEPQTTIRTPFLSVVQKEDSYFMRVFSMSGDLVGFWLYLVPLAFYFGGLVLSIIVFVAMAFMVYYSEMLLLSCAALSKKFTLWEIVEIAYSPSFANVTRIWLAVYRWCEITLPLMFLNQLLAYFIRLLTNIDTPDGPGGVWLDPKGRVWTPCLFVCVILPLSFFRKKLWLLVHSYKMGFLLAIYFTIVVICEACSRSYSVSEEFSSSKSYDSTGFLSLFPMACYSFCKGDRVLHYYQKMKSPNIHRVNNELRPSRLLNLMIIIAVGIFGYITWCVKPYDLGQFNTLLFAPYPKNPEWILGVVCLILVTLFSICESIRNYEMYLWIKNRCLSKIVSVCLLVLSVIFSIFVFSIKDMMIWAGCLVGSPVCLLFPLMCYVKLKKKRNILKRTLMKLCIIGLMSLLNIIVFLAYLVKIFVVE